MIVVAVMAMTLWGIGMAMGAPRQARWTMIGLLLVAVLMVQVIFPEGHPLREATGGSPALWLLILGFALVVQGYRKLLGRVRARAEDVERAREPQRQPGTFGDAELDRYARHMVLREIGGPGQKRLREARVLVVGAGGLGCPALQYLAGAGVGTLGVIDDDAVSASNLQRQVLFREAQIDMPKVFAAQEALAALNPFVTIRPYDRRLTEEIAEELFADYDLVLEGSDNFETRYLANRAAVAAGVPLIGAALSQWEGQISVWDPTRGAPCYQCVFPEAPAAGLAPSCAEAGVLGPLPGVLGSMMATEAVKLLAGAGTSLRGRLMIYDALEADFRSISVKRRADCPVCGGLRGGER